MKRLLKYCLILVIIFILLGMVVPLGLFAYQYSQIGNQLSGQEQEYAILNSPSTNGLQAGSISSIVVFNLAASVTLFLQQFYWFKINKKEQYPVPTKLTKKYSYVGYLFAILIIINICWSTVAFSVPIDSVNPKDACLKRIWIYGSGLIVNSILTFAIVGYSEYVNLQILYNQNVQMVDEGVANGTYDPITRMPYDEIADENKNSNESFEEQIIIPDLEKSDSNETTQKE